MSKSVIYILLTIFGMIGGFLGSKLDGGALLGIWSIIGTTVGGFLGVYIGYKIQQ